MAFWSNLWGVKPHRWLWDYSAGRLRRELPPPGATLHVLFMIADHWEPAIGEARREVADARVRDWTEHYPRAALPHRDADGRPPQHTFFYPYDMARTEELERAAGLAAAGLGEVELHLHHQDDTSASLTRKLEDAVAMYRRAGCLGSRKDGTPGYGFVHGDWALDNSIHEGGTNYCGVNDELRVLARTGCYADFTLPAFGCDAQPRWVNRIMRVTDDPVRPKSYDRGVEARAGCPPTGDLVLIPGPWMIHRPATGRVRIEDGDLTGTNVPDPGRTDAWVRAHIHVRGRPEWIFIKAHTHGCADRNRLPLLTRELDRLWTDLERRYNDGERYRLHYVTAREAYNIVRAAEDGCAGDPGRYRDYEIAPPPCRAIPCPRVSHAVREVTAAVC